MKTQMKELTRVLTLLLASCLILASCSDDKDDTSRLKFEVPAVYFSKTVTHADVKFESQDITKYYISDKPVGWDKYIFLHEDTKILSVSLPDELQKINTLDEAAQTSVATSGEITLAGVGASGIVKSAKLFVGLLPTKDLSDKPANSYIVNKQDTHYLIRCAKPDGTPVAADHVDVVWQDRTAVINHLGLMDDCISFFMKPGDTEKDHIQEGNAIIGAYDAKGNILWSWHIWATRFDPEKSTLNYANGYEMMDRNLGALANGNETANERFYSYGLYYQWGRHTPFVGPLDYKFGNGVYNYIYNVLGHRVYLKTTKTSAENGTTAFAATHPLDFLVADNESGYDWQWTENSTAWNAEKNNNDPCPYGWKVAPAAAFEGLQPAGVPDAKTHDLYSLELTDGTTTSLWMGGGRMLYNSGRFQNIYNPLPEVRNVAEEAQPWEGLYWTAEAGSDRRSKTFHFWYKKMDSTFGVSMTDEYQRANAMSVRCVREK